MIQTIVIIILAFAFLCVTCYCIFDRMRSAERIAEMDDIIQNTNKKFEDATQHAYDILKEWAESMDKHEKAYNDLLKKNNELSLEIERKNIEIERLNAILNYAKNDVIVTEELSNGDETIPVQS